MVFGSPVTKLIGLHKLSAWFWHLPERWFLIQQKIRGASEKFKNQPRPLLRPRSVDFRQHFRNLSRNTVPLNTIFRPHDFREFLIHKRTSLSHTPDIMRVFEKEGLTRHEGIHEFQKVTLYTTSFKRWRFIHEFQKVIPCTWVSKGNALYTSFKR
jgi:hypothetical protein